MRKLSHTNSCVCGVCLFFCAFEAASRALCDWRFTRDPFYLDRADKEVADYLETR